jgi:hypothetical protein
MLRQRLAKATAVLERLERQAVSLDRLDVIAQEGSRLLDAGITYDAIEAKRHAMNSAATDGVQYDFNDALRLLYAETFGSPTVKEEL